MENQDTQDRPDGSSEDAKPRIAKATFWLLKKLRDTTTRFVRIFNGFFVFLAKFFHNLVELLSRNVILTLSLVVFSHFFTSAFNPFNLDRVGDENAAYFLSRTFSPFYGGKTREAQKEIVVVLITPEDMKSHLGGGHFPPSYAAQIELLERINQFSPKAIFLDLYYTTPHNENVHDFDGISTAAENVMPAWEEFQKSFQSPAAELDSMEITKVQTKHYPSIEIFAQNLSRINEKTPIYIGPVYRKTGSEPDEYHTALAPIRRFLDDAGGKHETTISIDIDAVLNYPSGLEGELGDDARWPAAHALFFEYCKNTFTAHANKVCNQFEPRGVARRALAVEWGYNEGPDWVSTFPAIDNQINDCEGTRNVKDLENTSSHIDSDRIEASNRLHEIGCTSIPALTINDIKAAWTDVTHCKKAGSFNRYGSMVSSIFQGVLSGERDITQRGTNRCFYHLAIPVKTLFSNVSDAQLRYMLEDKIVMIGADQPQLSDNFNTPTYGVVPGVMLHAMALDNLIEKGANHNKVPRKLLYEMDTSDLFSGIVLMVVAFLLYIVRERDLQRPSESGEMYIYRWSRYLEIVFGFTLASMALAAIIGKWPLGNIFEIGLSGLGMVFILEVVAKRPNA